MLRKFQFTPLREGRPAPCKGHLRGSYFNSRPSARGDLNQAGQPGGKKISIHAPPRGATCAARRAKSPASFQFTPLREGRRRDSSRWHHDTYFNSRPSARGDGIELDDKGAIKISIHAPPRGATEAVEDEKKALEISIHAPPRGATWISDFFVRGDAISIHAPPRGATRLASASSQTGYQFQFTPLREGRQMLLNPIVDWTDISIHAPPRGATQRSGCRRTRARYFNSRPSARGDTEIAGNGWKIIFISIHAPPRGATVAR